jgi:hypothetical protein
VEETTGKGREFTLERPFACASVCLVEITR